MEERKAVGMTFSAGRWPMDPAKSTIIFIHGSGGSKVLWDSQVGSLTKRVNTVALDLPGHGNSEGSGEASVKEYARLVEAFVGEIDAPKPIPCGLSLGGAIAQQLLIDYADRFIAGMLVSTGARLKVMPAILETIENDYNTFLSMLPSFAASEKTNPQLLQPLMEASAKCPPKVASGDFRACNDFDVMDRLSSIAVPVLVISAEDDKLTPPKYGAFLEKSIPNAIRAHIMDAGHLAPIEKPEEVNQAILEFLDRHGL